MIYEITLKGWDANDSTTDHLVKWVSSEHGQPQTLTILGDICPPFLNVIEQVQLLPDIRRKLDYADGVDVKIYPSKTTFVAPAYGMDSPKAVLMEWVQESQRILLAAAEKQESEERQPSDVVHYWLRVSDQLREALELDLDDKAPDGTHVGQIIDAAAAIMDDACTWEIVGDCVFKATDGKYYVGSLEFSIREANPDYINELVHEVPETK